jgi:hypothetical protein
MRRAVIIAILAAAAVALAAPGSALAAGEISSLSVSPDAVRDGASSQGTVTLAFPDPADTTVLLFSSDPSAATVPATVIVPAGAISATFTIGTNAAAPETIVSITAWVGNTPRTASLWVNAATPGGPTLTSVSFVPATVTGGSAATGTVRFSATTDGRVVQLSSANPAVVQVPAEVVVNGGQASGAFPLTTAAVSVTTAVVVTARWFGVTRTATMTVTPGAPAPPDTVKIKKASWKKGLLKIEATSTNPNAILSVYGRSGAFMFTLTNNGGGRYSDQRGWVDNPQSITVRSNFGGSASAPLTR